MTRFLMTLEDAVDLVLYAFENGKGSETYIMKAKSVDILTLAKKIISMYGSKNKIEIVGERKGEKTYEVLISEEEMNISVDHGKYIVVDWKNRNVNKYKLPPYTSNNCERFTDYELRNIIINGGKKSSSYRI